MSKGVMTRLGSLGFVNANTLAVPFLGVAGIVKPLVGLFKAPAVISVTTVLADLTECDYTGYVRQAITAWNNPGFDSQNRAVIQSPTTMQFQQTGPPYLIDNTVYGCFLLDTNGFLAFAQVFDTPVGLAGGAGIVFVTPAIQLGD